MKTTFVMLLVLLIVAPVPSFAAEGGGLQLRLEADRNVATLGDTVECRLVIAGSDVSSITAALPGDAAEGVGFSVASAFVYPFGFKPSKTGAAVLGPIRLTFQGQKLVSNSLTIQVDPAPPHPYPVQMSASTSTVRLGESFELTLVVRGKLMNGPALKPPDGAQITVIRSSWSSAGGIVTTIAVYRVTPGVTGDFVLNAASFENLPPDGVFPQELKVRVAP